MSHLENMRAYYENEGQEEYRLNNEGVQRLEYLTATKYLEKCMKKDGEILDNCAGTGIYAFDFARKGWRVTAGDIVPYNVEIMREKEKSETPLQNIYEGDATDLSRFAEGSFDAVLCMGAFYHLPQQAQRQKAVREGLRVLRPGGVFACTYINRYAVILNNLTPTLSNLDDMLDYAQNGQEGIFYASTAGEVEGMMEGCGLQKQYHVALDGMAFFLVHTAGLVQPDAFKKWKQYHFAVCEDASLLGSSYHNLYIGTKK